MSLAMQGRVSNCTEQIRRQRILDGPYGAPLPHAQEHILHNFLCFCC
jgi:hypothetical protein